MKCFDGLIGIKGLCEDVTYRYYLDDLGVSLNTASKLADERNGFKGKTLIESKISEGIAQTISDMTFGEKITRPIIEDIELVCTDGNYVYVGGITHEFKTTKCRYSKFYIGNISIDVTAFGNLGVSLIADGVTTVLYADTADVGMQIFYVNKEVGDFQIIIEGDVETSNCPMPSFSYVDSTLTSTYGLNMDFQLRCSIEKHVCKFTDLIAEVARYKIAAMLMNEINLTNNLNEYIICKNKEDIFIQMAMLDSTYNLKRYEEDFRPEKGQYQRELAKLKLPPLLCNCCMEVCKDTNYIYQLNLP